jgi:Uma2 family endonuclease
MTPLDYLQRERQAEFRSEYHLGQIFAMAGASRRHNRIVTNISTSLDIQLMRRTPRWTR